MKKEMIMKQNKEIGKTQYNYERPDTYAREVKEKYIKSDKCDKLKEKDKRKSCKRYGEEWQIWPQRKIKSVIVSDESSKEGFIRELQHQ